MKHTPTFLSLALLTVFQSAWGQSTPALEAQLGGSARASALAPLTITAQNAKVGSIKLRPQAQHTVADGRSQVNVYIELFDLRGQPLTETATVTLEAVNGLIQLNPGAPLGLIEAKNGQWMSTAEAADIDPFTPGIQISVTGSTTIALIAPYELKDIDFRATAGMAQDAVVIKSLPELRDRVMVGVIEGQARFNRLAKQLVPANEGDLFERELTKFATEFGEGKSMVGARAAMFVKGKVSGDYLLTMAADSELSKRNPLFKDLDPNAFYPVYGDESIRGTDAPSTSRFYVRIDKNRSFFVYGDFNTAANTPLFQLGATNRSMTGVKWHVENLDDQSRITLYANYDSLKQVVNEIPGRGVSGPYSLSNANGVVGSERVEVIVRDRNAPNTILRTTALARGGDYEFEPFSGKLLFRAVIPSVDEYLNPVSIRVQYEVEQGGPRYWAGGIAAVQQLGSAVRVGATISHDDNPSKTATIGSLALKANLGSAKATFEVAQTSNETIGSAAVKGSAARGELAWQGEQGTASLQASKANAGFDNPSANVSAGRSEVSAKAQVKLTDGLTLKAQAQQSQDTLNDSKRQSSAVSIRSVLNEQVQIELGVRQAKDTLNGAVTTSSAGASSGICSQFSGYNGGFGIASSSSNQTDSLCQNGSRFPVAAASIAAANPNVDTRSVFAELSYTPKLGNVEAQLGNRLSFSAQAEVDTQDSQKRRYGLAAKYQVTERSQLFARFEDTTSVTGLTGLSTADKAHTRSMILGASTNYSENGQIYNEYRLNDAVNGKQAENAIGLRNTITLRPGLKLSSNAEWIKVFAGTGSHAKAAGLGLDYTASSIWKSSARIEWRQDNTADNWLSTATVSRRLSERWSLLAKNYYSTTSNRNGSGRKLEDRFLIGAAYRPVDTNWLNMLMRYEHRTERDSLAGSTQPKRDVDIVSWHGDWHPSRSWHNNARMAAKRVDETLKTGSNTVDDAFSAYLLGARFMYDWTPRWTTGVFGSMLSQSKPGSARQFGYGAEAGYAVKTNLWFNVGFTWRGLNDKDLVANDYRNRGWFVGLRYKFDENSFQGLVK